MYEVCVRLGQRKWKYLVVNSKLFNQFVLWTSCGTVRCLRRAKYQLYKYFDAAGGTITHKEEWKSTVEWCGAVLIVNVVWRMIRARNSAGKNSRNLSNNRLRPILFVKMSNESKQKRGLNKSINYAKHDVECGGNTRSGDIERNSWGQLI